MIKLLKTNYENSHCLYMQKILLCSFMTKSFLLLLFLIFILTGKCFSQDLTSQIFPIDNIRAERGVVLNKGWKFQAGDDPQWSKTEYNDNRWQPINPALKLYRLPSVKAAGIGWFRLKIRLDPSLINERVIMVITSSGASEIYLNEKLVYKFGKVSSNYEDEQTRVIIRLPISLKFDSQLTQQLAIRYSFHKKNVYMDFGNTTCLDITLKEYNQAFSDYKRQEGFYQNIMSIHLSVYLPLGLLFLFLYYSYRLQKEYLCMGFYFISMFLGTLSQMIAKGELITVNQFNFLFLAQQIFGFFGLLVFSKWCLYPVSTK